MRFKKNKFFLYSITSVTSATILMTSFTRLSRGFHTSFTVVWAGLQTSGLKRRKGTSFTGPPKKALPGGRVGPDSSFTPRWENRDGRSTKDSHVRGSGPQHSSQLNSRTGNEYFQKMFSSVWRFLVACKFWETYFIIFLCLTFAASNFDVP